MANAEGENSADRDFMTDLAYTVVYPFALRAAIVLQLPSIIDSQGPGAALSAKEICAHLPNPETASPENLEKILEVLSCHGLFSCSVDESSGIRSYGLTAISERIVRSDVGDGFIRLASAPELIQMWPNMHKAVLNPEKSVFERVYGKGLWQYLTEDVPELGKFHQGAMEKMSALHQKILLEHYSAEFSGFTGKLVDVGGSRGSVAAAITARFPSIKCVVNFDLPEVVGKAPTFPRVEHVGGSFLDFVPEGDMMFMKFVLLNWDDEKAEKILKNCHKALPATGKMIIVDKVKVDTDDPARRQRIAEQDAFTSLLFTGGKTRTLKDFQVLTESAGFTGLRVAKTFGDTDTCMEIFKV